MLNNLLAIGKEAGFVDDSQVLKFQVYRLLAYELIINNKNLAHVVTLLINFFVCVHKFNQL